MDRGLKPHEVAEMHSISRDTVMRHIRSGRLEGYKVGSQWRVRESVALALAHVLPDVADPLTPRSETWQVAPVTKPLPPRNRRSPTKAVGKSASLPDPYADLRRSD